MEINKELILFPLAIITLVVLFAGIDWLTSPEIGQYVGWAALFGLPILAVIAFAAVGVKALIKKVLRRGNHGSCDKVSE